MPTDIPRNGAPNARDGITCPAFVIVAAGGGIRHCCARSASWLDPARRAMLSRLVDAPDSADWQDGAALIAGHPVQVVRLHGEEPAFLLVIHPRPAPGPLAVLTPRQREVARIAAAGVTAAETAAALGLSEETVRTHLRDIYARLDIGTRVELANVVNGGGAFPLREQRGEPALPEEGAG